MNEAEKKAFLKKMGISGSVLNHESLNPNKKEKKDTRVDKSELVALARKFNVRPEPVRKQETLKEYLDANNK